MKAKFKRSALDWYIGITLERSFKFPSTIKVFYNRSKYLEGKRTKINFTTQNKT